MITCEEHDQLLEEIEEHPEQEPVGGAIGKHHFCPRDAAHAHQLLAGRYYMLVRRRIFIILCNFVLIISNDKLLTRYLLIQERSCVVNEECRDDPQDICQNDKCVPADTSKYMHIYLF